MPDVFTNAKRSQLMSRIRGSEGEYDLLTQARRSQVILRIRVGFRAWIRRFVW